MSEGPNSNCVDMTMLPIMWRKTNKLITFKIMEVPMLFVEELKLQRGLLKTHLVCL